VNVIIGLHEEIEEFGRVEVWVQETESLGKQAVETQIGTLLRATLQDHVAKLNFLSLTNVELQEFVAALLEIDRGHDHQVDGAS
jgi:hypothetical protein